MAELIEFINFLLCMTACVIAVGFGVYAWPRRNQPSIGWFVALCASIGWTSFFYALQSITTSDLRWFVTFSKLEYLGVAPMPVFWLGMAISFAWPERTLSRNAIIALLLFPAFVSLLAMTNELHGLIWQHTGFTLINELPVFTPIRGAAFWPFTIYSYGLLLAGTLLIIRRVRAQWRLYRIQSMLMLTGVILPWLGNIATVFHDLHPFPGIALGTFLLGGAVIAFAVALLRLGLFNFIPFAYQTIFNMLPLGVIILNLDNIVLNVNGEVVKLLKATRSSLEGKPFSELFPQNTGFLQHLPPTANLVEIVNVHHTKIEITASPIHNEHHIIIGTLLQIRDVTDEQNMAEQRLRDEQIAETVRDINYMLTSTLDTSQVLLMLLENVQRLVKHDASNIMIYDAATETATMQYAFGYTPEDEAHLLARPYPLAEFATLAEVARLRKPLILPNVDVLADWQRLTETTRIRGYACAPIVIGDELVGFLNLDVFEAGKLSPDIANRLEMVAQQASTAFRNARLYEQRQQQAEELSRRVHSLTILQKMGRDISMINQRDALIDIGLEAMLRLSIASGGFFAIANENGNLEQKIFYGNYSLPTLQSLIQDPQGVLKESLDTGEIAVNHTVMNNSAMLKSRAQVAIPLKYQDDSDQKLLGVVVLETEHPERFTQDRIELLGIVADRLSVSLQNIMLIEQLSARAAELERLYQQVSDLEALKSEMIRIAAHDLKNPLSVMIGYTTMLPDIIDDSPAELKRTLANMRESGERMDRIIRDFLSMERIGSLANNIANNVVDIRPLLDRVEQEFLIPAYNRNIRLDITADSQPLCCLGDSALIYEALVNFVSNAIKYTPSGGQILIRALVEHNMLRVTVTDTGHGIPYEEQSQIFTPFFRTKAARSSGVEGTGLGLHLTQSIIQRQNGNMIFSSTPGSGSTFGFEFLAVSP